MNKPTGRTLALAATVVLLVGGCARAGSPTTSAAGPATPTASRLDPAAGSAATAAPAPGARSETALAAEANPAGDIPDNQVFVPYTSADGGYALEVPEGWARTGAGPDVRFVSKLDGVQVAIANASAAPTAASARSREVAALERSGRAVQVTGIQDVQLPGGPAVLVEYQSNSEPDAVTGKQVRLENNAYLFFRNGKEASLTLWAPLGADNVDQWQQMARSFRWR